MIRSENGLDMRREKLKEEIERARKKLHEALSSGLQNTDLYRCSREMDQLIIRYIEETEQEKQIKTQKTIEACEKQ